MTLGNGVLRVVSCAMTYGGVFWYGLVVIVLSALAALSRGNALDALVAVAINWTVFVLPVLLIRNFRRRRRTTESAPAR